MYRYHTFKTGTAAKRLMNYASCNARWPTYEQLDRTNFPDIIGQPRVESAR